MISFFAAGILSPRLLFGLQMDQAIHHYIGWRLTEGELPYVGGLDQNFPAGDLIHAIAIAIGGTSGLAFAAFDLAYQAAICYAICRLVSRFGASWLSQLLAVLMFACTYIGLGAWSVGQRDGFAVLPFLAALLIAIPPRTRMTVSYDAESLTAGRLFATGVLAGITVLFRPLLGMVLLALTPILWQPIAGRAKRLVLLSCGVALPLVVLVIVYALAGHLRDLTSAAIDFNLQVYSKFRHGVNFRGSGSMTLPLAMGIVLLAALQFKAWRRYVPLLIAAVVAPISTFIQGQGDSHHMLPTYAVCAVLAGVGYESATVAIGKVFGRRSAIIAAAIFIGAVLYRGIDRLPFVEMSAFLAGTPLESIYGLTPSTEIDLDEDIAVGKYLRLHSAPSDAIQIWGMRTLPYTYAERRAASRFHTNQHLLMQPKGQSLVGLQQTWRREYIKALAATPPRFILVTTNDHLWLMPKAGSSLEQLENFPEMKTLLSTTYLLDTVIGGFNIYRQR